MASPILFLVELFSKSSLGFGARIGVLKISEGCFGVPVESREDGISFLQSFFLCACSLKEKVPRDKRVQALGGKSSVK